VRESGPRPCCRVLTDRVVDGTPTQCRDRLAAYRRFGIDLPILSPFARGPGAKERFAAVIRACAPAANAGG